MRVPTEYCGIQVGITYTDKEKIELLICKPYAIMIIYPKYVEDYFDDRKQAVYSGYMWKMGKAELHYRMKKIDKHARRWVRRHNKAVRV